MKNSKFKLMAGLLSLSLVLAACGNTNKENTEEETQPVIEETLEDTTSEEAPVDSEAEDATEADTTAE